MGYATHRTTQSMLENPFIPVKIMYAIEILSVEIEEFDKCKFNGIESHRAAHGILILRHSTGSVIIEKIVVRS